jgi:hypothetical protein
VFFTPAVTFLSIVSSHQTQENHGDIPTNMSVGPLGVNDFVYGILSG